MNTITDLWHSPALITPNNFIFKSLSNWAFNIAVGCSHACRFCYPECDEADLRATLTAIAELDPITIFHEPINIRAENVMRIAAHAKALGLPVNTDVFATRERWQDYAVDALQTVERLAGELGLSDRLHLWPDKSLGARAAVQRLSAANRVTPQQFQEWLARWWARVSEWPTGAGGTRPC